MTTPAEQPKRWTWEEAPSPAYENERQRTLYCGHKRVVSETGALDCWLYDLIPSMCDALNAAEEKR